MYRVVVTEKHFSTFFGCVEKEKHILKEMQDSVAEDESEKLEVIK